MKTKKVKIPKKVRAQGPDAITLWQITVGADIARESSQPASTAAKQAAEMLLPNSAGIEEVRLLSENIFNTLTDGQETTSTKSQADKFHARIEAGSKVVMVEEKEEEIKAVSAEPPKRRQIIIVRRSHQYSNQVNYGKIPHFGNGKRVALIS